MDNADDLSKSVDILGQLTIESLTFSIIEDFYCEFKNKMMQVPFIDKKVFDICGTGGSGKVRFNLSTTLAIKMSENFTIAKHANRASSGKVGSIDVIEAMKIPICKDITSIIENLSTKNLVFLFASAFHPDLIKIAEARRQIGKPTVFNFIMPMLNPVTNLCGQMIGVSNLKMMENMAEIAKKYGKNIIFVHDVENKLDDVSITGKTIIFEVKNQTIKQYEITPSDFDLPIVQDFADISGFSDIERNVNLVRDVLQNKAPKPYLNFLKINQLVAENFFKSL